MTQPQESVAHRLRACAQVAEDSFDSSFYAPLVRQPRLRLFRPIDEQMAAWNVAVEPAGSIVYVRRGDELSALLPSGCDERLAAKLTRESLRESAGGLPAGLDDTVPLREVLSRCRDRGLDMEQAAFVLSDPGQLNFGRTELTRFSAERAGHATVHGYLLGAGTDADAIWLDSIRVKDFTDDQAMAEVSEALEETDQAVARRLADKRDAIASARKESQDQFRASADQIAAQEKAAEGEAATRSIRATAEIMTACRAVGFLAPEGVESLPLETSGERIRESIEAARSSRQAGLKAAQQRADSVKNGAMARAQLVERTKRQLEVASNTWHVWIGLTLAIAIVARFVLALFASPLDPISQTLMSALLGGMLKGTPAAIWVLLDGTAFILMPWWLIFGGVPKVEFGQVQQALHLDLPGVPVATNEWDQAKAEVARLSAELNSLLGLSSQLSSAVAAVNQWRSDRVAEFRSRLKSQEMERAERSRLLDQREADLDRSRDAESPTQLRLWLSSLPPAMAKQGRQPDRVVQRSRGQLAIQPSEIIGGATGGDWPGTITITQRGASPRELLALLLQRTSDDDPYGPLPVDAMVEEPTGCIVAWLDSPSPAGAGSPSTEKLDRDSRDLVQIGHAVCSNSTESAATRVILGTGRAINGTLLACSRRSVLPDAFPVGYVDETTPAVRLGGKKSLVRNLEGGGSNDWEPSGDPSTYWAILGPAGQDAVRQRGRDRIYAAYGKGRSRLLAEVRDTRQDPADSASGTRWAIAIRSTERNARQDLIAEVERAGLDDLPLFFSTAADPETLDRQSPLPDHDSEIWLDRRLPRTSMNWHDIGVDGEDVPLSSLLEDRDGRGLPLGAGMTGTVQLRLGAIGRGSTRLAFVLGEAHTGRTTSLLALAWSALVTTGLKDMRIVWLGADPRLGLDAASARLAWPSYFRLASDPGAIASQMRQIRDPKSIETLVLVDNGPEINRETLISLVREVADNELPHVRLVVALDPDRTAADVKQAAKNAMHKASIVDLGTPHSLGWIDEPTGAPEGSRVGSGAIRLAPGRPWRYVQIARPDFENLEKLLNHEELAAANRADERDTPTHVLPVEVFGTVDPSTAWPPTMDRTREPAIPLGKSADGLEVLRLTGSLEDDGAVVILGGTTGSGKSNALATVIIGACATYSPEILKVAVFDFKGSLSGKLKNPRLPHLFHHEVGDDDNSVLRLARDLQDELDRRRAKLSAEGQLRVGEDPDLPMLLLVFDEYLEFLEQARKMRGQFAEIERFLHTVGTQGRELGFRLILATHAPERLKIDIGSAMSNASTTRIYLRLTPDQVQQLDDGQHAIGLRPGQLLIVRAQGQRETVVQTPTFGRDLVDVPEYVGMLAERAKRLGLEGNGQETAVRREVPERVDAIDFFGSMDPEAGWERNQLDPKDEPVFPIGEGPRQRESLRLSRPGDGFAVSLGAGMGAGKSNALATIILSACNKYSPEALRLAVFDFKGSLAGKLSVARLPHLFRHGVGSHSRPETVIQLWRELQTEFESRERLLGGPGGSLAIGRDPSMPMILIVFDEYLTFRDLAQTPRNQYAPLLAFLEMIGNKGREIGFRLVLATTDPAKVERNLPAVLAQAIDTKLYMQLRPQEDADLGLDGRGKDLPIGRILVRHRDGTTLEVQTPYLGDEIADLPKLAARIAQRANPLAGHDPFALQVVPGPSEAGSLEAIVDGETITLRLGVGADGDVRVVLEPDSPALLVACGADKSGRIDAHDFIARIAGAAGPQGAGLCVTVIDTEASATLGNSLRSKIAEIAPETDIVQVRSIQTLDASAASGLADALAAATDRGFPLLVVVSDLDRLYSLLSSVTASQDRRQIASIRDGVESLLAGAFAETRLIACVKAADLKQSRRPFGVDPENHPVVALSTKETLGDLEVDHPLEDEFGGATKDLAYWQPIATDERQRARPFRIGA